MNKIIFLGLVILSLISTISFAQQPGVYDKIQSFTSQVSKDRLKADIDKLISFHNRNTFSDTVSETKGVGAARRWLYNEFQKINKENGGNMKIYYDYFYHKLSNRYKSVVGLDSIKLANVVAILPGTSSERMLHFNGHYDSRTRSGTDIESFAPGANDDGSGTVALLEMARILGKEKHKNTIMLAATIAEEQGLLGATHISKTAKSKGWQLEGAIANDMISNIKGGDGKSDNTYLRCFSPDPVESPSRNLALYLNMISDNFVPTLDLKMIFRLDRFGRGGDHSPFVREGFAGVRFTEPFENYTQQHSPYDTPDNMSFEYFTRTTQLNVAIAAYWANSPVSPMLVSIRRDENLNTTLNFICEEPTANLKGFNVLMRETDSGYWTESQLFPVPEKEESRRYGESYKITLNNRDQDYYIFGIASVNKEGYESIATTYDRERMRALMRTRQGNTQQRNR